MRMDQDRPHQGATGSQHDTSSEQIGKQQESDQSDGVSDQNRTQLTKAGATGTRDQPATSPNLGQSQSRHLSLSASRRQVVEQAFPNGNQPHQYRAAASTQRRYPDPAAGGSGSPPRRLKAEGMLARVDVRDGHERPHPSRVNPHLGTLAPQFANEEVKEGPGSVNRESALPSAYYDSNESLRDPVQPARSQGQARNADGSAALRSATPDALPLPVAQIGAKRLFSVARLEDAWAWLAAESISEGDWHQLVCSRPTEEQILSHAAGARLATARVKQTLLQEKGDFTKLASRLSLDAYSLTLCLLTSHDYEDLRSKSPKSFQEALFTQFDQMEIGDMVHIRSHATDQTGISAQMQRVIQSCVRMGTQSLAQVPWQFLFFVVATGNYGHLRQELGRSQLFQCRARERCRGLPDIGDIRTPISSKFIFAVMKGYTELGRHLASDIWNHLEALSLPLLELFESEPREMTLDILNFIMAYVSDSGSLSGPLLTLIKVFRQRNPSVFQSIKPRGSAQQLCCEQIQSTLLWLEALDDSTHRHLALAHPIDRLASMAQSGEKYMFSNTVKEEKIQAWSSAVRKEQGGQTGRVFERVKQTSESVLAKNTSHVFLHSLYQTTIASVLLAAEQRVRFAVVPPGNGKTYIILQVVLYELSLKPSSKEQIIVFVKDDLLANQMKLTVEKFLVDKRVRVIDEYDPQLHQKPDVAIVDEADYLVEHKLVNVSKSPSLLHGLSMIRFAQRVYMLSATASDYVLAVLRAIFGQSSISLNVFPSQVSISAGTSNSKVEYHILGERALRDKVAAIVREKIMHKPVMLFATSRDEELIQNLERISHESKVLLVRIDSKRDAKFIRILHAKSTRGIFVVDKQFAIGYDLRAAVDMHVMIIIDDTSFGRSQVDQAVGRSSRSFDQHQATVLLNSDALPGISDVRAFLASFEMLRDDDGPEIIATIIRNFDDASSKDKATIVRYLLQNDYRISWSDLKQEHPRICLLFKQMADREI